MTGKKYLSYGVTNDRFIMYPMILVRNVMGLITLEHTVSKKSRRNF